MFMDLIQNLDNLTKEFSYLLYHFPSCPTSLPGAMQFLSMFLSLFPVLFKFSTLKTQLSHARDWILERQAKV